MTAPSKIGIPVHTNLFLRLVDFLKESGSQQDPVFVVESAIEYWMDNAAWKQDILMPDIRKGGNGYYWQTLFLPDGSKLRMKYKGNWFHAVINDGNVIYDGINTSPSAFVNEVTKTNRNAWKDIWIKRPNDTEWLFADSLRKQRIA